MGKVCPKNDGNNYDLQLIGVYGYYQAMHAKEDLDKLKRGIALIELAMPYYFDENLYIPLADFYLKLGNKNRAIKVLNIVLGKKPDSKKAAELLAKLM